MIMDRVKTSFDYSKTRAIVRNGLEALTFEVKEKDQKTTQITVAWDKTKIAFWLPMNEE